MKRIALILIFALLLFPASIAESSHADDLRAGLSQAWDGLVGMAEDVGHAASDLANKSGVTQWFGEAVNDVSAWLKDSGLAEWAKGASASITSWFEAAGAWSGEAASRLQAFIDENGPAVEAWLARAGEDVQAAWKTLADAEGHTEEEISSAYETVVEALKAAANPFSRLAGLQWSFSSGVGGWSTDLRIDGDGAFSGEYHDSELGEAAEAYPEGTVYFCSFSGRMSFAEYVDDRTWRIRIDSLAIDDASEMIDDGIRFVPAEPYGISEGDEMLLYLPGTPTEAFTEEMRAWAHLSGDDASTALEDWFLYSAKNDSGFVGYSL